MSFYEFIKYRLFFFHNDLEGDRLPCIIDKLNQEDMTVVMSRYGENVDEIITIFNKLYLYDKNPEDNENHYKSIKPDVIYQKLENIGKCDHTYLKYIIDNYDNLNEVTMFLPASLLYNNYKIILFNAMINCYNKNLKNSIFFKNPVSTLELFFNFNIITHHTTCKANNIDKEKIIYTDPCSERTFGEWYLKNFGPVINNLGSYGGIVIVKKQDILSRPKSFYENLIKYLEVGVSPMAGHYFERAWATIFQIDNERGFNFLEYNFFDFILKNVFEFMN